MKNRTKVSLFAMLAIILVIGACGNDKKESTAETSSEKVEKVTDKQEITVTTTAELATLDSALYTDVVSSDAIGQIFEGLYRIDKNNDAELGIAKAEPKINEAKTVYTYQIRDEAKWSNGDPVTADDFVYAYQKVVNPATGSQSSNQMDIFENAEAIRNGERPITDLGVKALDEKTLEITLTSPVPYLAKLLTGTPFYPQNKKVATDLADKYGTNSENVIGNGPFTISKWDGTNLSWAYTKNKNYWDAKNVKLEHIDVEVAKETATGANLFDGGEVQYTGLTDEFIQKYQGSENYHEQTKALIGYLGFNTERENTGNVHLRKALALAFDKKSYTEGVLIDGSKPLDGFIPTDFAKDPKNGKDFRKENGNLMAFDAKEAKAEWELAKKDLGISELTLEVLSSDAGSAKKTVEYLQAQFEENLPGLTIQLKSVPLKNRLDLTRAGDYDVFFGTWTPDYADPINFLEIYQSNGGINFSKYSNPTYDAGITEVKTSLATEPEKRWDKMLELEKQLIQEDAAIATVYQGAQAYLLAPEVTGLQVLPFGRTVSYRLAQVN